MCGTRTHIVLYFFVKEWNRRFLKECPTLVPTPNTSNKLEAFPVTSPFFLFLCTFSKSIVCLLIKFCRISSFPVKPCAVLLCFFSGLGRSKGTHHTTGVSFCGKIEGPKRFSVKGTKEIFVKEVAIL